MIHRSSVTWFARRQNTIAWVGVIVLALAAGTYFARALRPWGPWAFSDSAVYVTEGWNWAHGKGPIVWDGSTAPRWVIMFAPGYPALLALGLHWTPNWIAVARAWDVVLVALWVIALGMPATKWAKPPWVVWSIAALFLFFPIVRAFSSVMSEPPFLVLNALLVWTLVGAMGTKDPQQAQRRWQTSVLLSALATLTRWAGLWSVLLLGWVAWQIPAERVKTKVRRLLTAVTASPAAFALWILISRWHQARKGRVLATSPEQLWESSRAYVIALGHLGLKWCSGLSSAAQIIGVWSGIIAITIALILTWNKARFSEGGLWSWLWAAMGITWVPFLWITYIFTRPAPSIDLRMFTPALVSLSMAGLGIVWIGLHQIQRAPLRTWVAIGGLVVLLPLWRSSASANFLATLRAQGLGYTHHSWHTMMQKGVLRAAEALPPSVTLISNDPEGLMLWLHRPALSFSSFPTAVLDSQTAPHPTQSTDSQQKILRHHEALVLISVSRRRLNSHIPFNKTLQRLAKELYVCYTDVDGGVFLSRPRPTWCPFRP